MSYTPPPGNWSALEVEHQALLPLPEAKTTLVSAHYLISLRKGCASCTTNHCTQKVKAPALLFFPAGELRRYGHPQGKSGRITTMRIRNRCFGIEPEADGIAWMILRNLSQLSPKNGGLLPVDAALAGDVQNRMEEMIRIEQEAPFGYALSLKAQAAQILLALAHAPQLAPHLCAADGVHEKPPMMRNVLLYLDDHFADQITVDAMAKLSCLSRSHFHQIFRQETGLPLMQYLTRLRVARACAALRDPKKTILEICHSHGFGSASRMYAAFNKYVGRSPGTFR